MVGASDPEWLQGAFSALVAIFDRVGLQTNVDKTVRMACQPCRAGSGNRSAEGYRRRVTGEGKSFRERQRERVACGECGVEIAAGSLSGYLMTQHRKAVVRPSRVDPSSEPTGIRPRFPPHTPRTPLSLSAAP